MTEPCFKTRDSNPPVCGVHNLPLVKFQVAIDMNAPELGMVDCFICSVSHTVAREVKKS